MKTILPLIVTVLSSVSLHGAEEQPNIILVMTDDQGYACLGAHGHPWLKTPHLDQMHAESIRFDRFMMGSTCAPSRAGLMTGSHSIRNGVTHTIFERERLNLEAVTIPQVLKPVGYTSGYFGKWHLGDEEEYQPENRGFDEVFIHGAGGIGQAYPGSCADVPRNSYFNPVFRENGTFVKTQGYCTNIIFQATLGWINEVKNEQAPFLAILATNAPHSPFVAPPSYQEKFAKLGFSDRHAGFYGMIEHIDEQMGLLFHKLDEWGIADNTIVIFTTDNGMTRVDSVKGALGTSESGEQMHLYNAGMKGLKGTVDEGGVRAPFLVKWPRVITEGRTVENVASYLDVLPTLAELAGAPLPDEHLFEGRSLVPFLTMENPKWEDRYLFQHVTRWAHTASPDDHKWRSFSVRNQRFRLVESTRYSQKAKKESVDREELLRPQSLQLFDMLHDPGQTKDVSSQHPELVSEMVREYEQFWESVRPHMINEEVPLADQKPYHVEYYQQRDTTGIPHWDAPKI